MGILIGSLNQVTPGLYFLSPGEGEVVAGVVEVKGSVPDVNFSYAELSYAFSEGENPTWFLIGRIDQSVHDDLLALWDTTTITDGVYRLKLSVYESGGTVHETVLDNIKVGNYTHYDSSTPTAQSSAGQVTMEEILTVTPTILASPEPTMLSVNPASISDGDIKFSLSAGFVLTIIILIVLAVYAFFRQKARK